jgi:hypothetical protein
MNNGFDLDKDTDDVDMRNEERCFVCQVVCSGPTTLHADVR